MVAQASAKVQHEANTAGAAVASGAAHQFIKFRTHILFNPPVTVRASGSIPGGYRATNYKEISMTSLRHRAAPWALAVSILFTGITAYAAGAENLKLTGAQEVPPVSTSGTGTGSITVANDGSISGSVTTKGVAGTAAHIHTGARGVNGPVIITLTRTAEGVWSVPTGSRLNAEQLKAYRAGGLYVNVHTDANKGGEVRAQLAP